MDGIYESLADSQWRQAPRRRQGRLVTEKSDATHNGLGRAAKSYSDGEWSVNLDTGAGDGTAYKDRDGGVDLPDPLKSEQDSKQGERNPDGVPHGSRAATRWNKKEVPKAKQKRFNRMHKLQHDHMAVRDAESDSGKLQRREQVVHDTGILLENQHDQERVRHLIYSEPDNYRTSSWNRIGGFDAMVVGYSAVLRFDGVDDAMGDVAFIERAGTLLGKDRDIVDVRRAIRYGFQRFRDRMKS